MKNTNQDELQEEEEEEDETGEEAREDVIDFRIKPI